MDVEISPTTATVWGLFNQNININAIQGDSKILTWAASWEGADHVMYADSLSGHQAMIEAMHGLLEEADYVVSYNGDKFDLKIINKEFLEAGLSPPSPYRSIDLLKTVRRNFRFTSNKLDYVSNKLGLGSKLAHSGYQLWLDCMAGKKQAYKEMLEYNVQDVILLENLFYKLTPWISNINRAMFSGTNVCTRCGSKHFQNRGTRRTLTGAYQRIQCQGCGGWDTMSGVVERREIAIRRSPIR